MTKGLIHYRTGYKYQLAAAYQHQLRFVITKPLQSKFFACTRSGVLHIQEGYAWDGASGPTRDTKNSMRASLVHDVLYQAVREQQLPVTYRPMVDAEFWFILEEDGMRWWRSWMWVGAVRRYGNEAATKVREVLSAP